MHVNSRGKAPQPQAVLVQVLNEVLSHLLEVLPDGPSAQRISLRDSRARLQRAYPRILEVNASELAQQLAEEDGEPVEPDYAEASRREQGDY